jgi:hypothetical protein
MFIHNCVITGTSSFFSKFPFLLSWRKPREHRIWQTSLLHKFSKFSLPSLLEKDQGKQNQPYFIVARPFPPGERQRYRKLAGLYCCTLKDFFGGKIYMFSKQKFEKYPPWKTVF